MYSIFVMYFIVLVYAHTTAITRTNLAYAITKPTRAFRLVSVERPCTGQPADL